MKYFLVLKPVVRRNNVNWNINILIQLIRFNFNIFDGTPDVDSPWARYLDQDHSDDEVDGQDRDGETLPNANVEQS